MINDKIQIAGDKEKCDFSAIEDRETRIEAEKIEIEYWMEKGCINERGETMLESFYQRLEQGEELTDRQITTLYNIDIWYVKRFTGCREGYIYMANDMSCNQYKVGFSKDPIKRVKSFKTARPMLQLRERYKAPSIAEKYMHRFLEPYLIKSEWYRHGDWVGRFYELCQRSIDLALETENIVFKKEGDGE
jgi:hypothetical protein